MRKFQKRRAESEIIVDVRVSARIYQSPMSEHVQDPRWLQLVTEKMVELAWAPFL